jgi:hypothetical protein
MFFDEALFAAFSFASLLNYFVNISYWGSDVPFLM